MAKRIQSTSVFDIHSPEPFEPATFMTPEEAVDTLQMLYDRNTQFLRDAFEAVIKGAAPLGRYRAFYPEVRIATLRYDKVDSRLPYGFLSEPGLYSTTITRPQLFRYYLKQQIGQLLKNH